MCSQRAGAEIGTGPDQYTACKVVDSYPDPACQFAKPGSNTENRPLCFLCFSCRSIQVEGAFGLLKNDYGFRRFLTTGKRSVRTELFLLGMGFNLKKLWKKRQAGRLGTHLSVLDSA